MARTLFVNPSRRRRGKKTKHARSRRKARKTSRRRRSQRVSFVRVSKPLYRRNAGIAPFVQNPLIMSPNPRRRRRRNPSRHLTKLNVKSLLTSFLTYGGGAAVAVGANALALNAINNFWARNGARFAGAVGAGMFMPKELGLATAGGMFYPMMQELAAKFLHANTGTSVPVEADLEGLAADLEDIMDELDESDLSDGDDDDVYVEDGDDEDDILS